MSRQPPSQLQSVPEDAEVQSQTSETVPQDAQLTGDEIEDYQSDLDSYDQPDPLQMLMDVLVTENNETLVDVLSGIKDELHQTNKILFRISNLMGAK